MKKKKKEKEEAIHNSNWKISRAAPSIKEVKTIITDMKHQAPLLWSFPSQKSNYRPKFHRVSGWREGGEGMMRTYCIIHQAERNYRRGNGRGRREGAQRGIDGYFNAAEGSSFFIRATSRNWIKNRLDKGGEEVGHGDCNLIHFARWSHRDHKIAL